MKLRASRATGRDDGFTMVEMLIVFSLLAITLIPLATVQFQARHQVSEAELQTRATQIAMGRIERARTLGFANATGDTLLDPPFTASTRVVADPVNPFLQEVQVTVTWRYRGNDRRLVLAGKLAAR
jgi:prepilin-type N-terminal cleavage/methylation domain-containing protein